MKRIGILFIALLAISVSSQNTINKYICPSPLTEQGDNWCCYFLSDPISSNMSIYTSECSSDTWKKIEDSCCTKFYNINYIISGTSESNGRQYMIYKSPFDSSITDIKEIISVDYNTPGIDQTQLSQTTTSQWNPFGFFNNITLDSDVVFLLIILAIVAISIIIWILKGKDE
jgi:hypothetical protein